MQENKDYTQDSQSGKLQKLIKFLSNLPKKKRDKLLILLKEVQDVQKNEVLTKKEKAIMIKNILWLNRSASSKLIIGAFLGSLAGLYIFGTGSIGIAALGSGIGVWGWLASAAGGAVISSLIQNFEKK